MGTLFYFPRQVTDTLDVAKHCNPSMSYTVENIAFDPAQPNFLAIGAHSDASEEGYLIIYDFVNKVC